MARAKVKASDQKRMLKILVELKRLYPDSRCSLTYQSPFQLLIATVLSAQCTDARVNQVTPELFKKFPTPQKMAQAKRAEIEKIIRSTGFFKSKAQSIENIAKTVVEKYQGKVPQDMESLIELRGVGRKTANVIRGNAFGIPGLVVDTHVGRISRRLGFTQQKDPVKVEFEMMEVVPKKDWTLYSHLLIDHGRAVCQARSPSCDQCTLVPWCPKEGVA